MAGSATDYLERQVLQHTLLIAPMAPPPAVYVALCVTLPSDAAPGDEVVGRGYRRSPATFAMLDGQPTAAANTAVVEFQPAMQRWGSVSWLELWDALAGGNRLYWGPLVDPEDGITPITRTIQATDILRLPAGSIVVTAD